jgi:hypothetical protein
MTCAKCGARTQLRAVSFSQNIGMIAIRHTSTVAGSFCGPCILSAYWSCSLTTAIVGWFGFISFIMTPFILLLNAIELMRSAKLVGGAKVAVAVLVVFAIPAAAVATIAIMVANSPARRR